MEYSENIFYDINRSLVLLIVSKTCSDVAILSHNSAFLIGTHEPIRKQHKCGETGLDQCSHCVSRKWIERLISS